MSTGTLVTAEDLLDMPGDLRCELVEGEVVELSPTKAPHGIVSSKIDRLIGSFVEEHRLGVTGTAEVGYVLRRDPDTVRAPDVSFVSRKRIPADGIPDSYWPFAPDLAVEVVSPSDGIEDLISKVGEYLSAGSRLVWVVSPRTQSVTAYLPNGEARLLRADDTLDGGEVLPGFSVPVRELFATGL